MKSLKTLYNESSLSRVHAHTQGRNIGMITAHRGEFDASENKKRNKFLNTKFSKLDFILQSLRKQSKLQASITYFLTFWFFFLI